MSSEPLFYLAASQAFPRRSCRQAWSKYTPEEIGEAVSDGKLRRFLEAVPPELPVVERRRQARMLRRAWHAEIARNKGVTLKWLAART